MVNKWYLTILSPAVCDKGSLSHKACTVSYSQSQRIKQRQSGEFRTRGDQISRALMHCRDRSPITSSIADFLFFGAFKFQLVLGKCWTFEQRLHTSKRRLSPKKNWLATMFGEAAVLWVQSDSSGLSVWDLRLSVGDGQLGRIWIVNRCFSTSFPSKWSKTWRTGNFNSPNTVPLPQTPE